MIRILALTMFLVLVAAIGVASSAYIVSETEQIIVTTTTDQQIVTYTPLQDIAAGATVSRICKS